MSDQVVHPFDVDPQVTWPGHVQLEPRGVSLAVELLEELESLDADAEVNPHDLADLEDWPREGRPFRNIVLEYLQRAHQESPEAQASFCAVLSDFLSICCAGAVPEAGRYRWLYRDVLDTTGEGTS